MYNLVLFGAPGSGKGTQSQKIIDAFGLYHISTGDLLREQIARGTELGRLADSYISKGGLIPDTLMIEMLEHELDDPRATKGVIFDGFPRTVPQADALKKMLAKRGTCLHCVIGLEVDDEELMERLVKRGKDSGRSDDNPEAISNRLKIYHSTTQPLREYYLNEGNYQGINGSGDVDEIFGKIESCISSHPEAPARL